MVLCLVDDLLFSIKISTAAKALGAAIFFERSPDMALARVREKQPSLVILDLNSAKLRPLAIIAQMKADPALKAIRTLGYVSHVQTDVIAAARAAGRTLSPTARPMLAPPLVACPASSVRSRSSRIAPALRSSATNVAALW
jgi:PleD family two-component response regulator